MYAVKQNTWTIRRKLLRVACFICLTKGGSPCSQGCASLNCIIFVVAMKKMKNPLKVVWIVLGFLCLGLGTIGIVLPILPTVPFYMATLFCFAKSSKKLHDWFIGTNLSIIEQIKKWWYFVSAEGT